MRISLSYLKVINSSIQFYIAPLMVLDELVEGFCVYLFIIHKFDYFDAKY